MSDVIQGNYEQLQAVAKRFEKSGQTIDQMHKQLTQKTNQLRQTWEGRGAEAFGREMQATVLPGVRRLATALQQANAATAKIAKTLQQAEQEASGLFKGDSAGGSGDGGADGGSGGADGGSGSGGASGGSGSGGGGSDSGGGGSSSSSSDPNPGRDPKEIFNDKYMDEMRNTVVKGSDSQTLNTTMERLLQNPPAAERDQLLQTIANERGRPVAEIRAEYEKFLSLRAAQQGEVGELNSTKSLFKLNDHPDFLGSTASLRYGKVVGDTLGVDPVFGALLNPTGGLMGPNGSFPGFTQPGPNTPLGMHSVFHDAAGYLRVNHGVGPGYDYLGQEGNYDPNSPLTGQKSGIKYWGDKMDDSWGDRAKTTVIEKTMGGVRWIGKTWNSIFD